MKLLLRILASRPVMILTFYLVVLPVGLLMRALGRDPMARKPNPSAQTYRTVSIRRDAAHMKHD